eukprot:COSAG04_NODE_2825_length_3532_cov_1.454413_8_plen_177_part_00
MRLLAVTLSRWLMLLMVVVTLTGNFGLAPMDLLYFDPEKVLKFQVRPLHPPAPLPLPPATPSGQPGALGRGSLARAPGVAHGDQLLLPGAARLRLLDAYDDPVRAARAPLSAAAPSRVSTSGRKQHSTQLEANSYDTPADFLVMLIVCGAALLVWLPCRGGPCAARPDRVMLPPPR